MPAPNQINLDPLAVAQHHAVASEFWETRAKILLNDLLAVRTENERLCVEVMRLRNQYEPAPEPLKES